MIGTGKRVIGFTDIAIGRSIGFMESPVGQDVIGYTRIMGGVNSIGYTKIGMGNNVVGFSNILLPDMNDSHFGERIIDEYEYPTINKNGYRQDNKIGFNRKTGIGYGYEGFAFLPKNKNININSNKNVNIFGFSIDDITANVNDTINNTDYAFDFTPFNSHYTEPPMDISFPWFWPSWNNAGGGGSGTWKRGKVKIFKNRLGRPLAGFHAKNVTIPLIGISPKIHIKSKSKSRKAKKR